MVNLYATVVHVQESVYTQKLRHQQYSLSFVVAPRQCSSQAHMVCSHIMSLFLRTHELDIKILIVDNYYKMSLIFGRRDICRLRQS